MNIMFTLAGALSTARLMYDTTLHRFRFLTGLFFLGLPGAMTSLPSAAIAGGLDT